MKSTLSPLTPRRMSRQFLFFFLSGGGFGVDELFFPLFAPTSRRRSLNPFLLAHFRFPLNDLFTKPGSIRPGLALNRHLPLAVLFSLFSHPFLLFRSAALPPPQECFPSFFWTSAAAHCFRITSLFCVRFLPDPMIGLDDVACP